MAVATDSVVLSVGFADRAGEKPTVNNALTVTTHSVQSCSAGVLTRVLATVDWHPARVGTPALQPAPPTFDPVATDSVVLSVGFADRAGEKPTVRKALSVATNSVQRCSAGVLTRVLAIVDGHQARVGTPALQPAPPTLEPVAADSVRSGGYTPPHHRWFNTGWRSRAQGGAHLVGAAAEIAHDSDIINRFGVSGAANPRAVFGHQHAVNRGQALVRALAIGNAANCGKMAPEAVPVAVKAMKSRLFIWSPEFFRPGRYTLMESRARPKIAAIPSS